MTNVIAIKNAQINNENVQAVNARELHAFLEVGKMFANWINDRINQYGFVENQDYIVIANSGKNPNGGRPSKEYCITIDMAKELSMVERNEKGKQARKYFIECEKKAKQVSLPNAKELALMVIRAEEEKELLIIENKRKDEIIEKQAPAVAFVDNFVDGSKSYALTEVSKILNFKRKDFIECLERDGYLYRLGGALVPYEKHKCSGLFKVKTDTAPNGHNYTQTKITAQGLNKFAEIYSGELAEAVA